jgi:MFS family permease
LSWVFLALTKEPEGKFDTHDRDWKTYWKSLIEIIRTDNNFRRYIVANIVITIGSMGTGFMTVSAIQRFNIPDATVGLYTLVMLIGQTIGNLILGRMADRFGHKLSVEIGVFSLLLAFALALIAPSPVVYYVIYALLGINLSSGIVSGMMIVWEFCEVSRVPTYAGLANTSRGIFALMAPLLATQLAKVDYGWLFAVCTLLVLVGLGLIKLWVQEPRWHNNLNK